MTQRLSLFEMLSENLLFQNVISKVVLLQTVSIGASTSSTIIQVESESSLSGVTMKL